MVLDNRIDALVKRINEYKRTEHYSRLIEEVSELKKYSLSYEATFNLLAFSSNLYSDFEQEKRRNPELNTFRNTLYPFFIDNPLLFSIAESCELKYAYKFLMFVKPEWLQIANRVVDKYGVEYRLSSASGNGVTLLVFTFVEAFGSYSELEKARSEGKTVAQIIQNDVQEINGINAESFLLYLDEYYKSSFQYYCGGDGLDFFTGKARNAQSFIREDLNQLFRSSWEANVARVLNYNGVPWEYEKECFTLSDNYMYCPDFFLNDTTILEVKGFWDVESRKKVTQLQKEHPEIKVMILDADMYSTLCGKYKSLISFWEDSKEKTQVRERVPIVGMKYNASPDTIKGLEIGDPVLFVREHDNEYDQYAILATTEAGAPIGHISADWSFIYASKMDIGMEFSATIKEINSSNIKVSVARANINIDILFDFFLSEKTAE